MLVPFDTPGATGAATRPLPESAGEAQVRHDPARAVSGRVPVGVSLDGSALRIALERFDRLPPRQRQIAVGLGHGLAIGEIAFVMGITESTTRTHLRRLQARMGARDPREIAVTIASLIAVRGLGRPAEAETGRPDA